MYRSGYVYDEIDKVIIDIYLDYNFTSFPLDEREVCSKLGVDLVAYSEFPADKQLLLMKKSKRGFSLKALTGMFQLFTTMTFLNRKVQFDLLFFMN